MIRKDLVSTIVPVYNRPALLREAVESVLKQTYRPIEVIIVDDGSTDETASVAQELVTTNPEMIRFVHKSNGGPGTAREAGRLLARGEFIQYLDSDDILLPHKFQLQVAGLLDHPECDVAYGKTRYYREGVCDSGEGWKRTGEVIPVMFPSFLESRWWGTSTPLYRRTVVDITGPWTNLQSEEDWEYDCRVAALGTRLYYCNVLVSEQRGHPGDQISRFGWSDPRRLRDRAVAHGLIFEHAKKAGITTDVPEMRHFARELFLLSRLCGAKGLVKESAELFRLSRQASATSRANGWDFRLYALLAKFAGWQTAGKLCGLLEQAATGAKIVSGKGTHA
jgi:glycosyltransferase involved in cell wall biosynthesis